MTGFASGNLQKASAVIQAFSPARLRLARRIAGKTRKQLAIEIGKTAAAVTQFELGQNRPSAETLLACAQSLRMPVEFFVRGRGQLQLDTGAVHFRSLRSTRTYQREQALGFVELIWEIIETVEQHVDLPAPSLPDRISVPEPVSPAVAARWLRSEWNLEPGPLPHLLRNCEARGVVIAVLPRSFQSEASDAAPEHPVGVGTVDAFSTSVLSRPLIALTGAKGGLLRRRFNIAHELGHLLMHPEARPGDGMHEREAHSFAAEFLMPEEQISEELPIRLDVDSLLNLQRRWGVSLSALAYRGRILGMYTEPQHRRFMIALSRLGWRTAEPEDPRLLTGEEPALLRRAVELGDDVGVGITQIAAALALPVPLIRSLVGMPETRPRLSLVPDGSL